MAYSNGKNGQDSYSDSGNKKQSNTGKYYQNNARNQNINRSKYEQQRKHSEMRTVRRKNLPKQTETPKPSSYQYVNRRSLYLAEQHKKLKRQNRIIAVLVVLVILLSIISIIGIYCAISAGEALAEQEASAEPAANETTGLPYLNSDVSELTGDSHQSSEEASEEPMQKPSYDTGRTFTVNTNRLPAETLLQLQEELSSEYIVLYDMTADEIIYSAKGTNKCYPASTTKILTAVVASRIITDPKTEITVGDEVKLIGEDSSTAGLEPGMVLTFEQLMDALLLPSGNDAAYTMAVTCGRIYSGDPKLSNKKSVKVFMELVNDAAQQLGAKSTHFTAPDGFHDDNHYTSAEDLAKFAAYAKSIPLIKKSCAKAHAVWELKSGETLEWYNSNRLILWDSGQYSEYCDGMKTGFTDEAGTCVIASATMNDHTMIAVVMNSYTLYTKYDDTNRLFKAAFDLYDLNYTYGDA